MNDEEREERKWLEIIRHRDKPKEETPTEKVKREIEEALSVEHKILVKTEELNNLIPLLEKARDSEIEAIKLYTSLYELIQRINFQTGMLEEETKKIKHILDDEKEHLKIDNEIIKGLTY